MNRRDFLKGIGIGAASFVSAQGTGVSVLGKDRTGRKPNIVLIMADDLGYECLSCYGSLSYKTPVLDELARTGVRFENCHSQPVCTPSRVKIMTGRYNFRNYTKFGHFDFNEKTFAHVLKSAGYATCIAGKWQLMGRGAAGPHDAGFDEHCIWHMRDAGLKGSRYRSPSFIRNGQLVEELEGKYGPDVFCEYILDFMERSKSRPFLAYYPMALVHGPFVPVPDSPDWAQAAHRSDNKYFADMVAYMDKIVGRILRKLDELGLRENTLVLFTGDNGTAKKITSKMPGRTIKGGKMQTIDAGTHVPLIADWKGTTPAKVCDDLVGFSDFLPTLAEAAREPLPENVIIDGRSFLPQIRGQKGNPREWIFCHYTRDGGTKTPKRFVRDKRWKLYHTGELFDVQADPLEQSPIPPGVGGQKAAAARKRLQVVLDSIG